jgi:3-isopropylmalate/(R)-2-methylmalate dehydratase small subunit
MRSSEIEGGPGRVFEHWGEVMKFEGRVWKFGDDVDTDAIIPARFLNQSDGVELAKNAFIDLRPEFSREVRPGDIILAGTNFGCGSSREHAPWAIKSAGIRVVVASGFARIFYRNAVNIGLPILQSEEAVTAFSEGECLWIDLESGQIRSLERDTEVFAGPLPEFMREIIQTGGLVTYIKIKGSL